jgi:hypothetical protein
MRPPTNIPDGPHHVEGQYWIQTRSGVVEAVSLALRQCEVDAIAGDRYLCVLLGRSGTTCPEDPTCPACVRRAQFAAARSPRI